MFFDTPMSPLHDLLLMIRQANVANVIKQIQKHGQQILVEEFEGKLVLNWALLNYQLHKFSMKYAQIEEATNAIIEYLVAQNAPLLINGRANPLLDACLIRDENLRKKIIMQIEAMQTKEMQRQGKPSSLHRRATKGEHYRIEYSEVHFQVARGIWSDRCHLNLTDSFGLLPLHYYVITQKGVDQLRTRIKEALAINQSLLRPITNGLYLGINFDWWLAFFVSHSVIPRNTACGALETAPLNPANVNCGIALSWLVIHQGKVGDHDGSMLEKEAKELFLLLQKTLDSQYRYALLSAAPKNRFHPHYGVTTLAILAVFSNYCAPIYETCGTELVTELSPNQRFELVNSWTGYTDAQGRRKTTAFVLLEYAAECKWMGGRRNFMLKNFFKLIGGFSADQIFVTLNSISTSNNKMNRFSVAHLFYILDPISFNTCIGTLSFDQRIQLAFADRIISSIHKKRDSLTLAQLLRGISYGAFVENVRKKELPEHEMRSVYINNSIFNKFVELCLTFENYLKIAKSTPDEIKTVLEGIFENYQLLENTALQAASKKLVNLFKQVNKSTLKLQVLGPLIQISRECRELAAQVDQDVLIKYIELLERRVVSKNLNSFDTVFQFNQKGIKQSLPISNVDDSSVEANDDLEESDFDVDGSDDESDQDLPLQRVDNARLSKRNM